MTPSPGQPDPHDDEPGPPYSHYGPQYGPQYGSPHKPQDNPQYGAPPPPPQYNPAYPPYNPAYPPQYNLAYPPQACDAGAPFGVDPRTGLPYSDKSKLVAGLLQVLIPLGIGRIYMGQTGVGVAQLLVTVFTCGIGAIWPFIDGILILVGDHRDSFGRPLRG